MRYRLRFLNKSLHQHAWQRIEGWGYPVELEDFGEVVMLKVGDDEAYVWYEFLSQQDLLLHVAAAPEARGRFLSRRVQRGVYWAAEFLGADKLWVVSDIDQVNRYVERLGWTYDADVRGWFKRLDQ